MAAEVRSARSALRLDGDKQVKELVQQLVDAHGPGDAPALLLPCMLLLAMALMFGQLAQWLMEAHGPGDSTGCCLPGVVLCCD